MHHVAFDADGGNAVGWKIDLKRFGQSLLITVGIRLPTQHFHVVCLSPEPVVGHTLREGTFKSTMSANF